MSQPPPWNSGSGPVGHQGHRRGAPVDNGPYPPPQGPPHRFDPGATRVGPPGAQPGRYPLASWGQRVAARLIDGCLVAVPVVVLSFVVSAVWTALMVASGTGGVAARDSFVIIFSVVAFLLATAYEVVSLRRWGRTIGKRTMKILVIPLEGVQDPSPLSTAAVLGRSGLLQIGILAAWLNPAPFLLVAVLTSVFFYLWPLWDTPNRQGVHDKVAGTVVVQTG